VVNANFPHHTQESAAVVQTCGSQSAIRREKNCQRQGAFLVNLLFFNQGFTQEVNQLCDPSAPDVLSTIIQVFSG
jgi:hypothetical protein